MIDWTEPSSWPPWNESMALIAPRLREELERAGLVDLRIE